MLQPVLMTVSHEKDNLNLHKKFLVDQIWMSQHNRSRHASPHARFVRPSCRSLLPKGWHPLSLGVAELNSRIRPSPDAYGCPTFANKRYARSSACSLCTPVVSIVLGMSTYVSVVTIPALGQFQESQNTRSSDPKTQQAIITAS